MVPPPVQTSMRRLSSRRGWIGKRVLPLLWFGFLAFLASALIAEGGPRAELLLLPLVLGVVGYFLMRSLLFDLVDEVWDGGDVLVVRNGNQEERIPLSAIARISRSSLFSPPRITLLLTAPSRFGDKIAFSPATGFSPFAKNTIAAELTERLEAKRRAAAGPGDH